MLENLKQLFKPLIILLVISFLAITFAQNSDGISLSLNQQLDPMRVEVLGLPETLLKTLAVQKLTTNQWQQFFQITVQDERLQNPPPMLGSYSSSTQGLYFSPSFPFIAGQAYQASFSFDALFAIFPELLDGSSQSSDTIVSEFALARPDLPATEVTAIYPSADELPENLLRFYIYFSAPMREGFVLENIQLLDAQGQALEGIFFNAIFELWDPSMQRLTLLFDPGRVKTGLRAHEEMGRALTVGETYSLRIGEEVLDANGNGLARAFEKTFTVIEADLSPPDVNLWQLNNPKAGSTKALIIRFPAPLDHALLTEFVQIRSATGELVRGEIRLEQNETVWLFRPTMPWKAVTYELTVKTELEDIAGNNLHGLFDIPSEEQLKYINQETITLAFHVSE